MSKDLDLRMRLTATDQNVAKTMRNAKKEVQGLDKSLDGVNRSGRGTASGMAALTTAGDEANRMFKLQKGALQQAGYQIQDFTVQVSSGTSAFVALGQQGSQLLGLLGPGGALLGAVLAIGSVIGGVFVNSLGAGEDAVDALDAAMDRLNQTVEESDGLTVLTEQIRDLARESEVAARARISSAMQDAQKASEAAARGIGEAFGDLPISDFFWTRDLETFTVSLGKFEAYLHTNDIYDELAELGEMFGLSGDRAQQAGLQIGEMLTQLRANPSAENFRALETAMGALIQEGGKPSQGILQLVGDLGTYFDTARDAADLTAYLQGALEDLGVAAGDQGVADDVDQMISSLEDKANAVGKTAREIAVLKAEQLEAAGADPTAIQTLLDQIDATYDAIEAEKAREESLKKAAEAATEADRAQRSFQNSVSSLIDQLDPLGAEFVSVYEKQQLLIQAAQQGLISEDQRDTLITQLVTDLAGAGDEYDKWIQNLTDSIDPLQKAEKEITKIWSAFGAGDLGDIDRTQVQDYVDAMREGAQGVTDGWTDAGKAMDQFADSTANSLRTLQGLFEEGDKGYKQLSVAIQGVNTLQAVNAVLNQGNGEWYSAFARMAAMAVNVAALGYSVGSLNDSDYDPTADRQAQQGTGTVLGSVDSKTESIANAADIIAETNQQIVNINTGMLRALERVQLGIDGAAAMIQRSMSGIEFTAPPGGNRFTTGTMAAGVTGNIPGFGVGAALATDLTDEILGTNIGGLVEDISSSFSIGLFDFAGDLLGSVFGGDTKIVDEGVQIVGGTLRQLINDTMVRAYAETKTDGGWFSGDDYDMEFQDLDAGARRQFSLVFESLFDSVQTGAETLGVPLNAIERALDEFSQSTQLISLEDLDADEQIAELEAYFGAVFDQLSGFVVPFLDDMQQAGEGLGETLARVATQVQLTQEALITTGADFGTDSSTDIEGYARSADALTKLFGGVEGFSNALVGFEDNFLSQAEQTDNLARRLAEALGELPLPEAREGYLALIQAQDLSAQKDQERYATLLKLQDVADEYYDGLKKIAEAEKDVMDGLSNATDSALSDLRASIESQQSTLAEAYQQEQQAIREEMEARLNANRMALSAAQEGLSAIRKEVSALEGVTDSLRESFQPIQDIRRFDALEVLRDALITGDLSGTGEAAAIVGEINASDYATKVEYERAQGQSLALLQTLENEGTQQLTAAEQSVAALKRQTDMIRRQGEDALEQAEEAYQEEVDRLDRIIEGAEREINVLRGIETGVLSVVSAIEGLGAALGREIAGDTSASDMAQIEQLYRTLLGREIGSVGREYWAGDLERGLTVEQIAHAIRQSDEYHQRLDGSHAAGLGSVPFDGYRAELHANEMVLPADIANHIRRSVNAGLRQTDIRPVVDAIQKLDDRLSRMEAYGRQTTKNTGAAARYQERWDKGGLKTRATA